jgi:peptidylprolyl isomerase
MSSSWKGPIVAVGIVVAISLVVLAVSLISLAGSSTTKTTATVSVVSSGGTATATVTATGATASASTATTNITGYPGTSSGPLSKEPTVTPPAGAPPTTLQVKDLIVGTGPEAKVGDMLTVNYFTLGAGHVIAGWDQGIGGMKVGGRRELIVPASLAYGAQGFATVPPIPPNAALVFVVDLLGVSGSPTASTPATSTPARTSTPATKSTPNHALSPAAEAHLRALIKRAKAREREARLH